MSMSQSEVSAPMSLNSVHSVRVYREAQTMTSSEFVKAHRNTPCLFTSDAAVAVQHPGQRTQPAELFPLNKWKPERLLPIRRCSGTLQLQNPSGADVPAATTPCAVGDRPRDGRAYVLSDINVWTNIAAASACLMQMYGVKMFRTHNLLATVRGVTATHEHSLTTLTLATKSTDISVTQTPYAADAAFTLVEGHQLWLLAPPSEAVGPVGSIKLRLRKRKHSPVDEVPQDAAFDSLLGIEGSVSTVVSAGQVLYVPSGWRYAVKNLTDVSFYTNAYLRPWNLSACIDWASRVGCERALHTVDLINVFDALANPAPAEELPRWGLMNAEIKSLRLRWAALFAQWTQQDPNGMNARSTARQADLDFAAKMAAHADAQVNNSNSVLTGLRQPGTE